MAILKKENVMLREEEAGKINELKLEGYEEVTEAELRTEKGTNKKKDEKV
ncbi:hypothetical protein PJ311_18435 [Bacillus sp. CLL-7-23]|uniref:Fur-regulated basic protein B n=1 Tax=Bacillus changyiensis TaxID=3004103 RepID=A0ABT4X8A6_9BACI|nr:hypothetical protein [Bacillus changyiensis]MDA1477272.1 hypothetical protein [Bacillus changyiensis]MDA7028520.1 hypothetical protein [Bacillus changyiensis]